VRITGHAIEVRLCAEDPQQGFMPQSGTLAAWRPSPALRTEHALRDGAAVPPFLRLDDRQAGGARPHARRGEPPAHRRPAGHGGARHFDQPAVAATRAVARGVCRGEATTAFIADHADALLAPDAATQAQAELLAACCCNSAGADGLRRWRTRCPTPCASRSTAWCTRRA
jgi:geranyl-CoA carboxylase alpha subunit